jgi:cyclopropane fatty-acyl-phospholipid synthase-like methyltransferase
MSKSGLLEVKKRKKIEEDLANCYGGTKWVKEVNELFPPTKLGCINYGYWDSVPEKITLELRERSQIELYKRLFSFSNVKINDKILEVGCGRGHGVFLLDSLGMKPQGIDLIEKQIETCRQSYPLLNFNVGSADKTGLKSNHFDAVISLEAAQHFPDFLGFCKEAHRILKVHKTFAISTFFFVDYQSRRRIKRLIPSDVSGTHHCIEIKRAENYLKLSGFKNIQIQSIGEHVFSGFSKWAQQEMTTPNHTPYWINAYNESLVDYFLIKGEK